MNFVVPQNATPGSASLTVNNRTQTLTGSMTVASAAPGVFSTNGMGIGTGAMLQGQTFQPGPFSVSTNGSPTPVSVFMTGLDLSSPPTVTIGGVPATVTFYGAQPTYPGMQQINFTMPASVAGAGDAPQRTAVIAISSSATPGARRIHLDTPNGDAMMGGSAGVLFTVLAP